MTRSLAFTCMFAALLHMATPWSATAHTQARPPQIEMNLMRCPYCGCECNAARTTSDDSSATSFDQDHGWVIVDSSFPSLSDDAADDSFDMVDREEVQYNGFCLLALSYSQEYSFVARGVDNLTDSTEALAAASSVCTTFTSPTSSPSASLMLDPESFESCMADSDASRAATTDSGILRFANGAFVLEDNAYLRSLPMDDDDY